MRNAGQDEAQAVIKIAGRNINNFRCANGTTLMAESEELKTLFMKVKEGSEKVSLKLSIQKTKNMAYNLITSWQINGEAVETLTEFIVLGSKITADGDCNHEIKRRLLLGKKGITSLCCVLSRSVVSDLATPWTVARQTPPSMGFSRQEYWSGLPFPSPVISSLDSRLKSRDITLPAKILLVRAMVFPLVL